MTPIEDSLTSERYPHGVEGQRNFRLKGRLLRRPGLKIGLIVLVLTFMLVAASSVLAHQVSVVRSQLEYAMELVPQLRKQLGNGNADDAQLTLEALQTQTAAAHATTTGPLWQLATSVPFIGSNFEAVREVAASAEDVTTRAIKPLMDKYRSLNWAAVSPSDGRFNVAELQEAAPDISAAATTVRLSYQRMAAIDSSRLIPELEQPIRSATEQLKEAAEVLDTASSTAELLPVMLGADGPRQYLLLVQNSAEARATGGISGALAILHTDDGTITLGEQTSAAALGTFHPTLDVDPEQVAIYTGRIGTQMQNVNLTPHFPTAAQTAKQMWEKHHPEQTVDGVLALDPVVLSHLLEATGPLDLTDPQVLNMIQDTDLPSSLTKENVVPILLSEVYREIEDPEAQDAYFAAVAGRVFSAFTEGQGDGSRLVKALEISAKEHRLYLWSDHVSEQNIIEATPLHGSVIGSDSGGATFGVYFNDGTGAKMDYYVTRSVQLIQACPVGEYGQFTIRVTATNNAPADAAISLPAYVTGGGVFGVEPGRIRTNYVVYGPAQAFVETATLDGQPVPVSTGKHGQRAVGMVSLELSPGESATIDVLFSKVVQNSEPHLRVTPTIQSLNEVVLPLKRESCG